ncbi:hypothetical protein [Chroococcidiopsis sp. CCMEE 29]|jgi:hypothetical protein|uniref:hypothetical protein n=1 Tax=Chroococcidiopsis sp. CCMEE 29 TaxID=155894 RepID=UPI0020221C74|nr:hypothetical protein [Chroococcidiopsis sp. CCMEE 29]
MSQNLWQEQIEQLLEAIFQRDEQITKALATCAQPFRPPIEIAALQLQSDCDSAACSWLRQLGFTLPKE